MKKLNLILFSAVTILVAIGCDSMENKQCDEEHNQEYATQTTVKTDNTARIHKASCRCGSLKVTYEGSAPERRTLCHCNSCQLRTGSAYSIQGRFPREHSKIEGESTEWKFPNEDGPEVTYRSCDSGGATYHFCPTCGTTVYWDIDNAPEVIGIALGTLNDPSFPTPIISAFEAYGHPWAMQPSNLEIIRLEYDELEEKLKEMDNKN